MTDNQLAIRPETQVQDINGNTYSIDASVSIEDLAPTSGQSGEPLWTIVTGQPKDARWRMNHPDPSDPDFKKPITKYPTDSIYFAGDNQLYAYRNMRVVIENPETGESKTEYQTQFLGPFGRELIAYPVGKRLAQQMKPKFDENAKAEDAKTLCRSNDYMTPDAQYKGIYSDQCRAFNPKTGMLDVIVCPMLKWGKKDPQTGKSTPPPCASQVVICVAFEWEGEMVVADVYFQKGSLKYGNTIRPKLRELEKANTPIYTYPIELRVEDAGIGNIPAAVLKTDVVTEFSEPDIEGFNMAIAKFNDALAYLAKRAAFVPDNGAGDEASDPRAGVNVNTALPNLTPSASNGAASPSKTITTQANKPNNLAGNQAKKSVAPLI